MAKVHVKKHVTYIISEGEWEFEVEHEPDAYTDPIVKKLDDGGCVVGYLAQDDDCPNPCTSCDGVGNIRSLSTKHIDNIDIDEAVELLKTDEMVVALSYFEHGNCLWDVQGGEVFGRCPDKQWDGTSFAGVWIPDKSCRDEITSRFEDKENDQTIQEIARVLAAEACEQYTSWANGDCYGLCVETFDSDMQPVDQDAVWGIVGREHAEKELEMEVKYK